MLRDQLIKILAWRLGDRTDMNPRALAELDYVQEVVLEQNAWTPWFLEKPLVDVQIQVGESSFPLPADYLGEIDDAVVRLVDPNTAGILFCQKEAVEDLSRFVATAEAPYAFSVGLESVQLSSPVATTYNVEWRYAAKDALMSAAPDETLWLKYAPDLVLAALGVELAGKHLQNAGLVALFQADLTTAWARLQHLDTAKREQNQTRIMGRVA